jgi:hypothetical protein
MLGLLFLSFYDSTMFSALHRDNSLSFLTLLNTKLVSNFMRFFAHQFAHHFDQFSPFFTGNTAPEVSKTHGFESLLGQAIFWR